MSKTSTVGSGDRSTMSRRSPLPLSELLVVDAAQNANAGYGSPSFGIPPTPTRSVTDHLAQMAFSPSHATPMSPMWNQYGMLPMSPLGAMGPVADLAAMWPPPVDAVDMLVQPVSPAMNLLSAMNMIEPQMSMEVPSHSPEKILELLAPHVSSPPRHHADVSSPVAYRAAPGLQDIRGTPPPRNLAAPAEGLLRSAPPAIGAASPPGLVEPAAESTPPGLEKPEEAASPAAPAKTEDAPKDPLMINLSERLANLDVICQGLGSDIAATKKTEPKKLHRI